MQFLLNCFHYYMRKFKLSFIYFIYFSILYKNIYTSKEFFFSSLKVKKRAVDILVKDLSHLQCIEHILHVQLHLINFALSFQGNDAPLPPVNLEPGDQRSAAQNSANDQVIII